MKKTWVLIVLTALLLSIGACSNTEEEPSIKTPEIPPAPTTKGEPTAGALGTAAHRWTENIEIVETATVVPEPTASAIPTTAPTETPEIVASVSDECLTCHMDQELLIETAAPEEKAPSESSGVG